VAGVGELNGVRTRIADLNLAEAVLARIALQLLCRGWCNRQHAEQRCDCEQGEESHALIFAKRSP